MPSQFFFEGAEEGKSSERYPRETGSVGFTRSAYRLKPLPGGYQPGGYKPLEVEEKSGPISEKLIGHYAHIAKHGDRAELWW